MIVKTIIDEKVGKKWEIVKHEEDRYSVNYYEYFEKCGWKLFKSQTEYYDKDCLEYLFEIKL
jgi:hypothetical protein